MKRIDFIAAALLFLAIGLALAVGCEIASTAPCECVECSSDPLGGE